MGGYVFSQALDLEPTRTLVRLRQVLKSDVHCDRVKCTHRIETEIQ